MARADAGESLRLTSNSPVGHPSILEPNPPAASMSPPANQSGTVSMRPHGRTAWATPRPQSSPKDQTLRPAVQRVLVREMQAA